MTVRHGKMWIKDEQGNPAQFIPETDAITDLDKDVQLVENTVTETVTVPVGEPIYVLTTEPENLEYPFYEFSIGLVTFIPLTAEQCVVTNTADIGNLTFMSATIDSNTGNLICEIPAGTYALSVVGLTIYKFEEENDTHGSYANYTLDTENSTIDFSQSFVVADLLAAGDVGLPLHFIDENSINSIDILEGTGQLFYLSLTATETANTYIVRVAARTPESTTTTTTTTITPKADLIATKSNGETDTVDLVPAVNLIGGEVQVTESITETITTPVYVDFSDPNIVLSLMLESTPNEYFDLNSPHGIPETNGRGITISSEDPTLLTITLGEGNFLQEEVG